VIGVDAHAMHMHKAKMSISDVLTIGVAHEKNNNVTYNIPTNQAKERGDGDG
jgi:hypothetical protein